jgi:hypothetical protein
MAFIPVPNAARVAITMVASGYNTVNTLWFKKATPYTDTQLIALATEVGNFWSGEVMPNLSQSIAVSEVYALDASDVDGPSISYIISPTIPGGIPDTMTTLNNAMTVTFKSAARGRSGRGRNYISGLIEVDANIGTWDTTLVDAMTSSFENLPTYITGTGSTHVVASLYTGGAARVTGVTFDVVSYRANPVVYSQRLRTRL